MGVLAVLFAASPVNAGESPTRSYTNRVRVGDLGSNGPLGCGNAPAISGGFANEFDRMRSKLFLFGFNPTGRFADAPFPGTPIPGGPTWRATVANLGEGSSGAGRQRVLVYCGTHRIRLKLVRRRARIAPSATATATARCPAGTEAVSGGFSDRWAGTNGSLVFGFRSRRVGRRGWQASAINTSDSIPSTLIAMANCARLRPRLTARMKTISVPAGGARSVRIDCGPGRRAWSAGFGSPLRSWARGGAFPYLFKRLEHRSWTAAAFASGPTAARFTLHIYCRRTS